MIYFQDKQESTHWFRIGISQAHFERNPERTQYFYL